MTNFKLNNISRNWINLVKPLQYNIKKQSYSSSTFFIEPLEKGFGITLANSLRRIMLSSIYGISICGFLINDISNEFSSVPGIKEDISEIILNLKSIFIKGNPSFKEEIFTMIFSDVGEVKARDIKFHDKLFVVNNEKKLFTITKKTNIVLKLIVQSGKGYVTADEQKLLESDDDYIPIDAIFSPLKKCFFSIEKSRIGIKNEFEKLVLNITTNGTTDPEIVLSLSAKILQEQLKIFIKFEDDKDIEEKKKNKLSFNKNLLRKVSDLELSVRSQNCLRNDNIVYIGDLVVKSETEMLKTPNFGKKSLNEIKDLLERMNLKFAMDIKIWPPKNLEELVKKHLEEN